MIDMRDPDPIECRARIAHGPAFTLDVDLQMPGRGVTAIFGPSGCGKSTLLRAIAGLSRPRPGRILVAGQCWQDDERELWVPPHRRPIGVVFQHAALFEHLDVRGNLEYGRRRAGASAEHVPLDHAISLLGIGSLLSRRPAGLSGGERQRVAIARALSTGPRLLVMDEPLASLDAPRKAELLPYFDRLQRELGMPILYVTHAVDEVARLAHTVLLMNEGRVQAAGPVVDLMTRLDLSLAQGEWAGALIEGLVTDIDHEFGMMRVQFAGAQIHRSDAQIERSDAHIHCTIDPSNPPAIGDRLRLRIPARDVSIALDPPSRSSIVNVLPATVVECVDDGPAQCIVRLQTSGPGASPSAHLLARVTRRSARLLELRAGSRVFAQIKGVAVLR